LKKLKIVLQSNYLYVTLFIFISIFIIVTTKVIKYESVYKNETSIIGIITDISYEVDKISFTIKSKEKIICNYYLNDQNIINYNNLLGKKVEVTGRLKEVYNNTIPNTFNYKEYLYSNRIYKTFTVNNIKIIKDENIFYKIKNIIVNKIANYNDNIKSYLSLFILGDKTYLDNNIYDNYRVNGIWHLFAVSGMHISLIILVLDKVLKRLKFKNIIVSLCLLYFMFLTSFSASIMRATIFYYLKCLLDYFHIKIDSKKILFLTAFIILLFNPFMFYNIGFRYSFIITYVIMYESNKITGNYFIKIFKIIIISFIVSLPITINMNYEVNILSIFLNVLYVPFISLIIFPLSILTFIFPFLSSILELLICFLEVSNNVFNNLKINIIIPKISLVLILTYYLLLYLFSKNYFKKYLLLMIIVMIFNQIIPKIDNNYYAYFLDVGQGDSTLLISPYKNEVIMIDTGGLINNDYQVSNNTLMFLKSLGISTIDLLIITHGDYDHMGEGINIIDNFNVEKVIFNNDGFNTLEMYFIEVLKKQKIDYYQNIKELDLDYFNLYFLNDKLYDNENDNSNIIYTEIRNIKFLFMGDAGNDVEDDLLIEYELKGIDVLKVGHHGSKTSSSKQFIDAINPDYSIISVGKNNRYGHPNDDVLNNLKYSKVYRTDQDGSIMFEINKDKLKIETCSP